MTTLTKYARVSSGIVREVANLPDVPAKLFHPTSAPTWFACGPDVAEFWTYASGTFTPPVPDVAGNRASAIRRADAAARDTLAAGFPSSALGALHTYRSGPDDVAALALDVALAGGVALLCSADGATWALAEHTAAQVRTVAADLSTFRVSVHAARLAKHAAVAAATTVDEIVAIP